MKMHGQAPGLRAQGSGPAAAVSPQSGATHDPRPATPAPAPAYFRSLTEHADPTAFRAWAEHEFPAAAMELDRRHASGELSRRRFLQLISASAALAGLGVAGSGCERHDSRILAHTVKPAEQVPGVPLYYATSWSLAGRALGVLAECHEGRPTKLEGNPKHPVSGGKLPTFAQAEVLNLYDPDRSRFATHDGRPARFEEDVLPLLDAMAAKARDTRGEGVAVLVGDLASPSLDALRDHAAATLPGLLWCAWSPLPAAALVTAEQVEQAEVIVAIGRDFIGVDDPTGQLQRAFAARRDPDGPRGMNRLYVVEPHLTVTGMKADHRLALPATLLPAYAAALRAAVEGGDVAPPDGIDPRWITEVAADLRSRGGKVLILEPQTRPLANPALDRLITQLEARKVHTLVIIDSNPVATLPASVAFGDLIKPVDVSLHLGLYADETAGACGWHVPMAHFLERWGDTLDGVTGTLAAQQPMIAPLLGGQNPLGLLARLFAYPEADPYAIVRSTFARLTAVPEGELDARFHRYLHEGVAAVADRGKIEDRSSKIETQAPAPGPQPATVPAVELVFAPDYSILDGRYANNGWLQELPDPVTKLVWDNAAILSPATAEALGVRHGELLEITANDATVTIAAFVIPGSAKGSIKLPIGYGRRRGGVLAKLAGVDVQPLRSLESPWVVAAQKVAGTGRMYELATTQEHWLIDQLEDVADTLEDRAIVREASLDHYREHPDFAEHMGLHVPHHADIAAMPPLTAPQQWGMVVDLNACTSCNACVIACQAENNIPIVGKDEVIRGREMHWMRIDRYFRLDDNAGGLDNPASAPMPMLCQHCENAPCEPVCPVNATVHDQQGLNTMVYNRCVGTRYCSNNCPYKVRRFNFYDYNKGTLRTPEGGAAQSDGDPTPTPTAGFSLPQLAQPPMAELLKMQTNPDVTVRMRGVMEKCTYCVQRIETAKIAQKVAAGQGPVAPVPDGALQTACQQTCPSHAIVFGDISDQSSAVSKAKASPRNYDVLGHLLTRPRTTYLAAVWNHNPKMPAVRKGLAGAHH